MEDTQTLHKKVFVLSCQGCPNSIKSGPGETEIKLLVRASLVERWKITADKRVIKCPDCVEKQVRRIIL